MATHSVTLAWETPWMEGTWQATVHGDARVRHDLATKQQQSRFYLVLYFILLH